MEAADFSLISLYRETKQNKAVTKWIGIWHFSYAFQSLKLPQNGNCLDYLWLAFLGKNGSIYFLKLWWSLFGTLLLEV